MNLIFNISSILFSVIFSPKEVRAERFAPKIFPILSITIMSELPPIIDEDTFEYLSESVRIIVPYKASKNYKAANYWNKFL